MVILRIEHRVPNFDGWRMAFDSDPIGRDASGVRRHRVMRGTEDANYALVDLEFDTAAEAETVLERLRTLWSRVEGSVVVSTPQVRIVEVIETREY